MEVKYLDNGFYIVSKRDARKLVDKLPKIGRQRFFEVPEELKTILSTKLAWLQQTRVNQKNVWVIHAYGIGKNSVTLCLPFFISKGEN